MNQKSEKHTAANQPADARRPERKRRKPRHRTSDTRQGQSSTRDAKREAAANATEPAKVDAREASETAAGRTAPVPEEAPEQRLDEEEVGIDGSLDESELGIGSRVVPHDVGDGSDDEPFVTKNIDGEPETLSEEDIQTQISSLEARLDSLIQKAGREPTTRPTRLKKKSARKLADRLSIPPPPTDEPEDEQLRELANNPYYVERWGRSGLRRREEDVDEFGYDPAFERRFIPALDLLYKRYFRVESHGIDRIPSEGRCVVVANHSGTVPLDGAMLRTAMRLEHPAQRELRWLAEDFIYYLPFAGVLYNRLGAVRACQENAERLLKKESLIAVFPEGAKGIKKLFKDRYRLERFGRAGYIRLCLRTQTPLVPCAIVGAEEMNPILYRVEYLPKLAGLPYLPITPTFPWLGPLGLTPAPTKWKLFFGEPIYFDEYGVESAHDPVLVGRLSQRVEDQIQGMLNDAVQKRRSVWFG